MDMEMESPDTDYEKAITDQLEATGDALRQAPRIAALQAAATVHSQGSGRGHQPQTWNNIWYAERVLETADKFLVWIQKNA